MVVGIRSAKTWSNSGYTGILKTKPISYVDALKVICKSKRKGQLQEFGTKQLEGKNYPLLLRQDQEDHVWGRTKAHYETC
jgi:hypothetical protein